VFLFTRLNFNRKYKLWRDRATVQL